MQLSGLTPATTDFDPLTSTTVLHAHWEHRRLVIWGEAGHRFHRPIRSKPTSANAHPFAQTGPEIEAILRATDLIPLGIDVHHAPIRLSLPRLADARPQPSDRLASALGRFDDATTGTAEFDVEALAVDAQEAIDVLVRFDAREGIAPVDYGHALQYWLAVAAFAQDLLINQRFVPIVSEPTPGALTAIWAPWLLEDQERRRFEELIRAMPRIARSITTAAEQSARDVLASALVGLIDSTVRRTLVRDDFMGTLAGRSESDAEVAWLRGLLGERADMTLPLARHAELLRDVASWIRRLEDAGSGEYCLCLRLHEPPASPVSDTQPELFVPDESVRWRLSFHLQARHDANVVLDAEQIWRDGGVGQMPVRSGGGTAEELLLTQLARAARIYPRLEHALAEPAPIEIDLTTVEAHQLLRDHRDLLNEAGILLQAPSWWGAPGSALGMRLRIDAGGDITSQSGGPSVGSTHPPMIGLDTIVRFDWSLAVGETTLPVEWTHRLVSQGVPLVRVNGQWVEIGAGELRGALQAVKHGPPGQASLAHALRMACNAGDSVTPLPVVAVEAGGWVGALLHGGERDARFVSVEQPPSFHGQLRPYQKTGLAWLVFLDRLGLGACLADDMGLGKTIQLIALLLHERLAGGDHESPGPTLLVVPTSLIANWKRELHRFGPSLRVHIHHGPQRPSGDSFVAAADGVDVVITTYGLVGRDLDSLSRTGWWRVVLDEAQSIKNPPTRQASAIRSLATRHRVALTGTPVENRLSELWSIMEFCNPGLLGTAADFRRRFAVPIERHRERASGERLRSLVRPFVLRRLKTDPKVIDDLPPCVETKEFANLTPEQAALYRQTVDGMLVRVDASAGIQRRGLVLSTLVRLKQICNHPAQFARAAEGRSPNAVTELPLPSRSGKCRRLLQMIEEVTATGDKALIFTQFRQMGHLLSAMIRHALDREVLFLHGGTPQKKRQEMIDRFQSSGGDIPVFVLSLKAGGVGLNLTAANHVFHFDRWWNPAVEKQATDRAFRIGQTRKVHVHKFVCVGTLEERIDQMIEQKTELAEQIVGAGEQWLTELSTGQLRDLFALDGSAVEDD